MNASQISQTLDSAAGLLTAVSRADTDPGTRVHCLLALDHLHLAGARDTDRPDITGTPHPQVIRAALRQLAALPFDVFSQPEILDAAAAARLALARAEDA